jgi:2-oxoglutarate ferredoxin oxidoreductase subunit beta
MNSIITAFAQGIEKSGIDPRMISVPSDIPIAPEVTKKLGVDYFHVSRGRAIAFGTGLKLGNPALKIVALVGDLMTLGGNHFVHTGRRNMELLVICINNYVYEKIAGHSAPKTTVTFSPYSTFEEPFNIPHLGNSCGALYTARWTALHTDELAGSIADGLKKGGLSVIEVIAPGPNYYRDINNIESDVLNFYYKNSEVKNGEDPRNVGINPDGKIIVGKFTDKDRPTFLDTYNAQLSSVLGNKFTPHGVVSANKSSGEVKNG